MHKHNIINLLKLQVKNLNFKDFYFEIIDNSLIIHISKKITEHECPCCNSKTTKIHDHRIQKIKHSPINGFKTFIFLKKTRLECKNCGKSFYMDYSDIVNKKFRCSNQLFFSIINDIQNNSLTLSEVAKNNNVSFGVVVRYLYFFSYLMQWENIHILPKHIGIDEFKGNCNGSKYLFHIYDLDTGKTVTILSSRKYYDLIKFFDSIDNRNEVELVTMDLYDSFRNAIKAKLKNATIVADRFHYTRIIANALDRFRLDLWNKSKGIEKKYFRGLKLSLLKNIEKVNPDYLLKHEEKLNYAFEINGDLKYAYQLYQSFLRINDADSYDEKVKLFNDFISDCLSSTLKTFKSAANTLLKWHKEILNSFNTHYTNSATEGKNNKIKVIKRISYGFRNLTTLRNIVMLRDCKI